LDLAKGGGNNGAFCRLTDFGTAPGVANPHEPGTLEHLRSLRVKAMTTRVQDRR
jgi:hypothetical protein